MSKSINRLYYSIMDNKSNYKYLLSDLSILKGVGGKTVNLLKKKKLIFLISYEITKVLYG